MQLTLLQWERINEAVETWIGCSSGIFSTIIFTISLSNRNDEYLITTNVKQIQETKCVGLENSKEKAQSILNSYAISQAIL